MKSLDKIVFASFIINLIFLISVILLPFIAIIFPETLDKILFSKDRTTFNMVATALNLIIFFFWGYCIWFLFKYDRYSKSIFPLFFLNALYAPIYYYRVKIKKRPLRNKINRPQEKVQKDLSVNEKEFTALTRANLIGVLKLWASKSEQLKLRDTYSSAEVSSELFDYWYDYTITESEILNEAFNSKEIEMLSKFKREISVVENKYNRKFPKIEEFIETTDWKSLNQSAKKILRMLNE